MRYKISIIIPAHNEEMYLERCLDSCINQTLEEIEIIMVDDASTDRTREIMCRYEQMYTQKIRCIFLTQNVRQGGARNRAIKCAQGEFVMFVDGDDWIFPEMCESLYKEAVRSGAEIVYCNNIKKTKDESTYIENRFPNEAVGNVEQNIRGIITQPYVGPCASIVRRTIITENNLYFPENIVAEDTAITKLWDLCANKISKIEDAYYVYCFNPKSTGQTKMTRYRKDEFECVKLLKSNLEKNERARKYKEECKLICMRYALNFVNAMLAKGGGDFIADIERDFKECISYIVNGCIEKTPLWKRWFTLKEEKCLLDTMDFKYFENKNSVNNVEDYRLYYERVQEEIQRVLHWFVQQGWRKVAIWGMTNYAEGLQRVFPKLLIVDNAECADREGLDCILCLRMLHIPNARNVLRGTGIRLFNLQSFLWTGEDIEKFYYMTYKNGNRAANTAN